jgi:hypothetical protein
MKQYLEQLRKECNDRMVNIVIDLETNKPSKVLKNLLFQDKDAIRLIFSGGFVSFVVVLCIEVY